MARLTNKRSDKRWQTEDGDVWASKLEAIIFERISGHPGVSVRRCSESQGDTFAYTTNVRSGSCGACGSGDIVQRRTYTPDLCLSPRTAGVAGSDHHQRRYLEIKGYFPGPKRNLLRAFLKTGPSLDLRLVLERDQRATRSVTLLEYCHKFFKLPVHIWDGQLPRSWYEF